MNNVRVSGTVQVVNEEKRDVTIVTKTPKGKDVTTVIHFWKTTQDGDNESWTNRCEWRDFVDIGNEIQVVGHLGNGGRIIAEFGIGFSEPDDDTAEETEETADDAEDSDSDESLN